MWDAETRVGNPKVSEVKMKGRRVSTIGPKDIRAALSQVSDPDLGRDIVTLGFVRAWGSKTRSHLSGRS